MNYDRGGTKGNLGVLQKRTRERCAAFNAVEALAIGTKHVELRGPDRFSPDDIAAFATGAVLDRREIEPGTIRVFKTETPMLWFDFRGQRHFVDVDLFGGLKYFDDEFGLLNADSIELPMHLAYRDTSA